MDFSCGLGKAYRRRFVRGKDGLERREAASGATVGNVRLLERFQEALDARSDGGPLGLVPRERGGGAAVPLARLAGRRQLGLEACVLG